MKNLNKIFIAIQLIICIGMSGTALAATAQSNQSVGYGGFAASQFKLDMILAKRGDPDAQYYVGTAYQQGNGTQKNMEQAYHWYSKAAQQGQPEAQYKLGYFYEHGLVVKRNMNTAMRWYKQAIDSSHGTLQARLRQEAFPHQTDDGAAARAAAEAKQKEQAAQEKARQQAQLRQKQQRAQALARERERLHKLAQARAREEAAYKQRQLVLAQRQKLAAASKARVRQAERVNIPDLADVILNNKWSYGSGSADYLPSNSTHCLRSSTSEIVCFSNQKQRAVNGQLITYTTKSSLTNFKSDGTFQVSYYYNVTKMISAPNQGASVDPSGLKLVKGWQEPQVIMNCRTVDRANLYCTRGAYRLHFHN